MYYNPMSSRFKLQLCIHICTGCSISKFPIPSNVNTNKTYSLLHKNNFQVPNVDGDMGICFS